MLILDDFPCAGVATNQRSYHGMDRICPVSKSEQVGQRPGIDPGETNPMMSSPGEVTIPQRKEGC